MLKTENIKLTEDPLKNIFIMAPYLDEAGQNRVFGMVCGLMGFGGEQKEQGENAEPGKEVV